MLSERGMTRYRGKVRRRLKRSRRVRRRRGRDPSGCFERDALLFEVTSVEIEIMTRRSMFECIPLSMGTV